MLATQHRQFTLDALARDLDLTAIPTSWRRHWAAFVAWEEMDGSATTRWTLQSKAAELFDLPAAVIPALKSALAEVERHPQLQRLATFWFFLLYELPDEIGDNSNLWPLPDAIAGVPVKLLGLVVLVAGVDRAILTAAATGLGPEISRASLAFIGQRVREVKEKRGVWGVESLTFLRGYVRSELFRLGRLTFRVSPFPWSFRVLRHRSNGGTQVFCDSAAEFRRDGLANGTNGLYDADAWLSSPLVVTANEITGVGVDDDGAAISTPLTIRHADWDEVISPGDLRVEVHVAGGLPLDADECAASYRTAMRLLPGRHSCPLAGFTCVSWLLDPTLRQLLPERSNILHFAEPYRLLTLPGDDRQAYDLIYGDPNINPASPKAPRTTALQRAIAAHVAGGGTIRAVTGVLTWSNAQSLFGDNA